MNRILTLYSNNKHNADWLTREAIKYGYKQIVIYTYKNIHTEFVRQFLIIEGVESMEEAQKLTVKKFGKRADFGVLADTNQTYDPEELLYGPRDVVTSDVIITYHEPAMIFAADAVESIINQSYTQPVIHLISDGVPTKQDPIFQKYKNYECIRTYFNKKSGPYIAINRVFQFLETDYISILDADDIAMPNRLWRAIKALEYSGADIYGGVMEQFIDHRYPNSKTKGRLERQPLVISGEAELIIHGTQTCKKEAFKKVNGYGDYFCGADSHFFYRAKQCGCKLYQSKHIAGLRRLHGSSLTNNNTHGSATNFRQRIKEQVIKDYIKIKHGAPPQSFGALDKYLSSSDIYRTNK